MLFMAWTGQTYRPTADMDFLGFGEDSSERIAKIFRSLCELEVMPDGLTFDSKTVMVNPIREKQEYRGRRVKLTALLEKARIPLQVDIGFGDVVTPEAEKLDYPTLLEFPAPSIRACPRETVVAEKFQAMVMLGIANSRMKDFYDLHILAREFAFDGKALVQAIKATFERRKTAVPTETPLALTDEFALDEAKSVQWSAFTRKVDLEEGIPGLSEILSSLRVFLLPLMNAASGNANAPSKWRKGGPWK
jgi:hypothetical protein